MGWTHLQPLNVVFGFFADELNSLQHVGDVVNPPFLHLQDFGGPVQVQNAICWLAQQPHKLLSEQSEGGVVARSFAWRLRCCVMKRTRIIYLFICSTALSRSRVRWVMVRTGRKNKKMHFGPKVHTKPEMPKSLVKWNNIGRLFYCVYNPVRIWNICLLH